MKKVFSFVAVSLALVLSASFISCKAPSGSSGGGGQNPPAVQIGTKAPSEAKAVGDIVFNDGSVTPYTAELTLTDEQKSKAIAIIYKVDGSRAYGVGLVHIGGIVWCISSANGYHKFFTEIICTPTGSADETTFTGDTNGSDNFTKIKEALGTDDDTGTPGNYPAFDFVNNYKNQTNSHVIGTVYENGWYLPSIAELFDIWKVRAAVNAASALCGGSQFVSGYYWSSSQYEGNYTYIYDAKFDSSFDYTGYNASNTDFVCCIHVF